MEDPAAVRSLIGLTGQFAAVDEALTARENLILFGRLLRLKSGLSAKRRADDLLAQFELTEAANRPGKDIFGRDETAIGLGGEYRGVAVGVVFR